MASVNAAASSYDVMYSLFNPQMSPAIQQQNSSYNNLIQSISKTAGSGAEQGGPYQVKVNLVDQLPSPDGTQTEYIDGRKITISNASEHNVNYQRAQALQTLNFLSMEDRQAFAQQLQNSDLEMAGFGGLTMPEEITLMKARPGPLSMSANTGIYDQLPGSQAESDALAQAKVEDLLQMVKIEKQLQNKYGDNIRLGYQPDTGWTMMRPGDSFYDQMKTGNEALQDLRDDISKGFYRKGQLDELFQEYGIHA